MKHDTQPAEAAQQYFHTYRISDGKEEIVLREYDLSVQSLSGGQRSIALATGLTVVAIGFFSTVLSSDRGVEATLSFLAKADRYAEAGIYAAVVGVAVIALRYFSELQRNATEAARKIVVLRRLLGVDYGNIEKVMPTGTLEGANEPYALPMFPGWGSISSLSSLLVAPFAGLLLLFLFWTFSERSGTLSTHIRADFPDGDVAGLAIWATSTVFLLAIFRLWLLERWENKRFLIGKLTGQALNCPFKHQ